MTTKFLFNFMKRGAVDGHDLTPSRVGHQSDSIVSRFSLVSLICLCMLTVGVGQMWGGDATVTLDFEGSSGSWPYNSDWTCDASSNATNHTDGGSRSAGMSVNGSQYITYKNALTNIKCVTFYINRTSTNTAQPTIVIQKSTWNGSAWSDWTDITGTSQTFSISRNTWTLKTFNFESYKYNGKVRIKYTNSTTAIKMIDDIVITYEEASCDKKVTITKGTPETGGSFSLDKTGEQNCCDALTVSVSSIVAPSGKIFSAITQSGIASGVTIDQSAKTVTYAANTTGSSTINVTFEAKGCDDKGASSITSTSGGNSNTYGPVDDNYKYSTRQILYTKSDLGLSSATKKGTIKSIYFYYKYTTAMSSKTDVKIYMANTYLTSLSTSSYVPYSEFTLVYSGPLNCTATNSWNEFFLDTPFEYTGAGNLVVMIDDDSGVYDGSSYTFYYHSATGAQIYKRSDSSNEDPSTTDWSTYTPDNYRPSTKFCIQEADMEQYTVNWYVNGSVEHSQTAYAGTTLTGIPTPDESDCDGSKVFVGWTTSSSYSHASTPPTFVSPTKLPDGGANYYAVFANSASSSKTYAFNITPSDFNGDGYAYNTGGTTTATATDASGATIDVDWVSSNCMLGSSKIQVKKSAGYIYNSTDLGTVNSVTITKTDGTFSTWYGTTSNPTSGSQGANKGFFTVKETGGTTGYISNIAINFTKTATAYSNYATSCCTKLGSINGSITSNTPTSLTLSWDAVTGAEKYQVKVPGSSSHDGWTDVNTTSVTVTKSCGTAYTAYFRAIDTNGSHCSTGPESTLAIPAVSWTVTSTGVTNATASPAIPSTTCSGFSTTISPATGYALPADITVTNATKSWNSSTGALSISSVTGNVSITITPTCISPVIGTDPADASYYVGDSPDALSVSATLASGTLTYLWKVSTNGGSTWSDAAGTNNAATYSGASLSASSAGTTKFKCIVGNSQGGCTVESGVATITVTAASYFVNGETVFIQADSKDYSAWKDDACVKAWFNNNWSGGSAETTYWLFDATDTDAGKKLFATVVPSSGDLNIVQLQRFAGNCSDKWNDNGSVNKASSNGVNTFRSYGSADNNVAWNGSSTILYLYGSQNSWESSLGTFADQGAGVWTATISNYTPDATSKDYKIKTSYNNGWIGNGGSNDNATLSGMIVGSTYNVTATLNVTTHALTMSKTFVKGEVSFDLQGHGSDISKLTNVTAGSKISAPSPAPSATGYTFGGWYKDAECTDDWDFANDVVNETMTLYAKWTANVYTITKTLTNVANAGLPASFTYTGSTTTALNSTFTVDATNYFLPASITVTMGGATLTAGTDYTYNSSTGAFTFDRIINGNIVITATATAKLKSIAITTQPTTRAYLAGETFSKTGAVVTATMGDGTTKAVTASATWTPSGALSAGTGQTVTATYTEAGIEKTATTTIDVYSVTVQKVNEDGDAIDAAGVSASITTRSLSASATSGSKYVFKNWEFSGSNNGLAIASTTSASTSVTGTPTGNVTIKAVFYKPVVITWLKGGVAYETGSPTTTIARGSQWKDLTLPTAPADNSLGACADKFMGWSNTMAVEWVKEDTHTAPATLFTSVTGNTTVINAPITFRAVFASAEEGDNFELVTSLSGIKEGDAYMGSYISYSGTRYYAGTSNSAMTSVTVSGTPLALSSTTGLKKVSIVATGNTNQYYIKDGTKFLYANSAGSAPTFSDNTCAWTFSGPDGNKLFTVLSSLGTYYLRAYASSTSAGQFKMYGTTTNSGICLFQKGVAYSDYVTVCCTQYDITLASSGSVTGGTFTASPTSACEDAEVTLSATPADGYSFAGWTVTKTASPYTDITSTNVDGNTLTMPDYGVTVNASFATLTGITVKTAPTKTTYCEGDNFDPTGLVITASFSNSTTLDIPYSGNEAKFTFSPTTAASLTTGNTSVTITYSGQSTSQAITVNSKLAVTKTGSGTVTGGTFTVDNATACAGTTINIEAEAASHYTFGSWTITKTSDGTDVTASVSIGSATSATTSFTMPAYGVTVTPTFNEDAYHTATFKNNGAVIAGYDAVKTYDGERPSAPTLTDITDACDKTDCNKFYGWIAEAGIWDKTINSVAGKTIYRNASSIPVVSGADVVYHAVWAKGTGVSIDNTLIAKWDKQALTASTAVYAKDKDGNTLDGTSGRATVTMTSTIDLNSDGIYGYYKSSISSYPTITISGLDFSGYSGGTIVFYARASAASGGFTAQYSTNNGVSYSDLSWEDATTTTEYSYIIPVSNSTTNVKISYTKNTGNFYFGTVRVYGDTDTDYDFTELTSSNTSGWSGADWDGYYLISAYYSSESKNVVLRSDVMEGLYGFSDVTPSTGVITTDDLGEIFKVTYNSSTNKYAIQSVATQDYLTTTGGGVNSKAYYLLSTSPTENNAIAYNDITQVVSSDTYYIRWNSDRFGSYKNQTSPTLYKIFDSYTEFRITCCDKTVTIGTPSKTGSGTVTFASGGDAYAAGDEVETCAGVTTITATVTPTNGYQCTVLSFSRSDSEDLTPDPAISVPFTGAQDYDLPFEQNADGVTLNTTVTFVALIDHYIDNMHYNTTQNKSGNYGTAPTLSDESKGEQCTGLHYKFVGWIPETDMNMTTGVPTTTANMVAGGATGKYATGTNYYAIWAEEE